MNHENLPPLKSRYKKTVLAMAFLLLLFMTFANMLLIGFERREYLDVFTRHTASEVDEAAAFMIEPLLRYQFSDVHHFIQEWSETHQDVIRYEAISPKGHAISVFHRASDSPFQLTIERKVAFAGEHLLTLVLTKDYAEIEKIISRSRNILLLSSLLIVLALGAGLWFVFRRFAVQPLEREITRRYRAEKELEILNVSLEAKVRQRTLDLDRKNHDLLAEIRQRETAESKLAGEKELLAVTLRSIGDAVITTGVSGLIVMLNKMAENLTGWRQEQAAGRPLHEVFNIIDETTGKTREDPVGMVMAKGGIVGLANHTVLIAKDGRELVIADSAAPIRDRDSLIVGVVLVFRDITGQRQMESELGKARKMESLGILAGGIAHDFNNILAAILGNINLALFDQELRDKTRHLLSQAEKASLRAKSLTQQLLTFAKGGEPVKETASLAGVITDSANFVLSGDAIACRFDIPEDLWLVDIDRDQIAQVIQNIVLNASHAMPEGGTIKIGCENVPAGSKQFALQRDECYVKIAIEDSGVGIPAAAIDKVFDPFFSTKKGGTGLGLAISQSIISKHGGDISVKSAPGKGTTFTIFLPASKQANAVAERKTEAYSHAPVGLKILVMDDDSMVRNIAEGMLTELGCEVVLAEDGGEAIELYREAAEAGQKFDLVIMDLTIPGGMGGKEAVGRIMAIDPTARVIVSSGYSNDPALANYKDYGFCASLVKPYQFQDLSLTINQFVQ
jgi:PAS domain S-box-containing protein